jgi:ketosteroid isomerase-like protein
VGTESLKRLEAGFGEWNRGEYDVTVRRFRDDVVWRTGGMMPDIAPVYEGREGVRRFFQEFAEPWERISIAIEEVLEDREDQVVVIVSFEAHGRDGIEVGGRFFQIYRYDDDHLIYAFHAFPEGMKKEALREAGLSDG